MSGIPVNVTVATAVAVPFLVLAASPVAARLRLRRTIRAIRDDGAAAIQAGKLRPGAPVSYYLQSLEIMAQHVRWAAVALAASVLPNMAVSGEGRELSPVFLSLRPEEQSILRDLQARVRVAIRAYLIWGRPLRWLASAPARRLDHDDGRPARAAPTRGSAP